MMNPFTRIRQFGSRCDLLIYLSHCCRSASLDLLSALRRRSGHTGSQSVFLCVLDGIRKIRNNMSVDIVQSFIDA